MVYYLWKVKREKKFSLDILPQVCYNQYESEGKH